MSLNQLLIHTCIGGMLLLQKLHPWNLIDTWNFFYGIRGGFKACPVCKIQIKGFYLFQLSFGQKCAAGPTTYQKQTVCMYINYTWPNPAGSA